MKDRSKNIGEAFIDSLRTLKRIGVKEVNIVSDNDFVSDISEYMEEQLFVKERQNTEQAHDGVIHIYLAGMNIYISNSEKQL